MVNDPLVREAEFTRKATREARPQAWAAYLPQIGGRWTKSEDGGSAATAVRPILVPNGPDQSDCRRPSSSNRARWAAPSRKAENWSLQLTQSIFNWGQLVGLKQAGRVAAQADADYGVAQQDLALRVSTRYFDVLAAQDNVQAQQASLDAISRQLEQADKRFEVGLIAITDVQEARAARDTAAADLIAAKRQLATAQELLREITDMQYAVLATPRATMPLQMPEPADPQKWVEASMEQNLSLTSSRLGADIARDDVRVQFGGHLPQVDLVVGKDRTSKPKTSRPSIRSPRAVSPAARRRPRPRDTDKSINSAGHRAHLQQRWHASRVAPGVVPLAGRQAAPRARFARDRAHRPRCLSRRRSRRSRACRRSSRRWSRRNRAARDRGRL